jgi:hypothetical protein
MRRTRIALFRVFSPSADFVQKRDKKPVHILRRIAIGGKARGRFGVAHGKIFMARQKRFYLRLAFLRL